MFYEYNICNSQRDFGTQAHPTSQGELVYLSFYFFQDVGDHGSALPPISFSAQ